MLKFSKGNAKLGKHTLIFSIPAGKTCPAAKYCQSWAVVNEDGKRSIQDGKHTQFRCFAASSEVQYDAVYESRRSNLEQLMKADSMSELINQSLQQSRTKNTQLVRIHESGDFFNLDYLNAWLNVAWLNPDLKFYCYSKSLHFFDQVAPPSNFYMTASQGGHHDHMIEDGFFHRYSVVCKTQAEADALGLEVDHDDSHCFGNKPFALLVHGTQPKGSDYGKAIFARRKRKEFAGYSK